MGIIALNVKAQGSSLGCDRTIIGRSHMSDEEETPESNEESTAPTKAAPTETGEEDALDTKESLREKFRLTKDEEILRAIKPSIFAFLPMYFLAVVILGVHLLFGYGEKLDDGDNGIIATILFALLDLSEIGEIVEFINKFQKRGICKYIDD